MLSFLDPRRTFSAVKFIPLAVGLFVALTLLPIMTLGYLGARDNTGRLLTANRDAMLDGLEQAIRDSLDGTAQQMAIVAGMIADGRVNPDDRENFARFMTGVAQGQTSMVSAAWLERTGPLRRWARDGRIEEMHPRENIYDVEGLWTRVDQTRMPAWRGPVMSRIAGAAIIPHIQPVVRNGELIGLIISVMTSESVSRYIDRMEKGVTPFVLIGRDRVLAHPNIRTIRMVEDRLLKIDEVDDPALEAIWTDPRRPAQTVPGRSDVHWSWQGNTYEANVFSYRRIDTYGGESWLIGFHRSSLATFRERWVVQGLFWGSGFLLLLSVALAWLLSRRAIQPVGEIAEAARALERLDFDAVERPKITGSHIAEFRDTAQAFGRAARALQLFQTYVPRALVGKMLAADEPANVASDREVSVLFMDLGGYSSFSEGRSAREVSTYLNSIFAEMGPIIEETGGTIDKYTGDGLMAVWGAPVADPAHAAKAWSAGLRIMEHMTPLVRQTLAQDPASCRIRLGLHTGRVLAGDIGFAGRINYTVVGRTVNVAQRCQAALKEKMGDSPVALGITESFRKALGLSNEGLATLPSVKGGETSYRVLWFTPAATSALDEQAERRRHVNSA